MKLHHYTSADTFEKIIEGRALWATCVADQKDDKEITYAAELLSLASRAILRSGATGLAGDIVERLPYFIEERKGFTFIACFCEEERSVRHFSEYGPYRLTFDGPGSNGPYLGTIIPKSKLWFQQVIYDAKKQQQALTASVAAVVDAVARCSDGRSEGGGPRWLTDSVARNAAQIILGMAIGFKRPLYKWERERRLVCCPRLGANSSSPKADDEEFLSLTKRVPRRHLELEVLREVKFFEPLLRRPVPIIAWESAQRGSDQTIAVIQRALIRNGRADLA